MMSIGWYSSAGALMRSSVTLGTVSECRSGASFGFKRVAIPETHEAMLSSLCDDAKLSLLATHLMSVCHVLGNTRVRYGRLGKIKSVIINDIEYQEKGGKVQKYELG